MIDIQEPLSIDSKECSTNFHSSSSPLARDWLYRLCLDAGADDVGFVEINRPELDQDRPDILSTFPRTKTLISFVIRMNREPIRSSARSVANLEFHHTADQVNEVARDIVKALEAKEVRALNPAMGFPMEMDQFPGKIWVVSHKIVAVAAGLGQMGIHRNVIHPKFGNFILLGTILIDTEITMTDTPINDNPCMECKLCVAACPVGAIGQDGHFNFSACYTHNYREFMGGFTNWVENVVESQTAKQYREKVNDAESASMWQSLSFGANYKAAYCLAVCPAGEEVNKSFHANRKEYVADIVKPLQKKEETIYVVQGSDAKNHVMKRFPHKQVKTVENGLRPRSIKGFFDGLPLLFQRHKAEGLTATYHFTFTGKETSQATVIIRKKTLQVIDGHQSHADFQITADSQTWLGFLAKERNLLWAVLRRKIRVKGPLILLQGFRRCFPS
ncbi:MAG: 4Fe-4S ferredoxin [Nitrospirales bacterium]|nr:4Fe-4S ferredoxin [Nitrospirales bacterium]